MKKILMAVAVVCALAACSGGTGNGADANGERDSLRNVIEQKDN